MSYSIYVDGAAPNNQHVCMRGGIGLVVMDEDNEIVHEESITIDRKTDCAELELLAFIEGRSMPKMVMLSIQIMITVLKVSTFGLMTGKTEGGVKRIRSRLSIGNSGNKSMNCVLESMSRYLKSKLILVLEGMR